MLQSVAECCSVRRMGENIRFCSSVLQCVAVCCQVGQYINVCSKCVRTRERMNYVRSKCVRMKERVRYITNWDVSTCCSKERDSE